MRLLLVPVIGIVIFALLFAGCTSTDHGNSQVTPSDKVTGVLSAPATPATVSIPESPGDMTTPGPVNLTVRASPTRYSPIMSSTVGIGLTPEYSGPGPVVFSWNTTYGHFVGWNAPDFNVIQDNDTVETTDPTIYWSYPVADMGKEKPPVTIRLIVKTPPRVHGGNGTIAWKEIRIGWEGNDTAVLLTPEV
jgi:hypothetical protein